MIVNFGKMTDLPVLGQHHLLPQQHLVEHDAVLKNVPHTNITFIYLYFFKKK